MVIHVPRPRFNTELRESPVWRNVGIKGNDDQVCLSLPNGATSPRLTHLTNSLNYACSVAARGSFSSFIFIRNGELCDVSILDQLVLKSRTF